MILPIPDDLMFTAQTVLLEAGNQSFTGKLAVAYVIRNRDAKTASPGVDDVVMAPWQFSAWNTDHKPRAAIQDTILKNPALWHDCMKAAAAALFELLPDPTDGATFYLNPVVTRQIRKDGTLPSWAADPADPTQVNKSKVTAVIEDHWFLRV